MKNKEQFKFKNKDRLPRSAPHVLLKIPMYFIMVFVLLSSAFAFSGVGTGTELDPFLITSPNEFLEMQNESNSYFRLANNISFSGMTYFPMTNFSNHIDGNNFYVSDIFYDGILSGLISDTTTNDNLVADYLTIQNLNIDNVTFRNSVSGKAVVARFVNSNINIFNVHVYNSIARPNDSGDDLGGIFIAALQSDNIHGIINKSGVDENSEIFAKRRMGGFIGRTFASLNRTVTIEDSYYLGFIRTTSNSFSTDTGCIIGETNGGTASQTNIIKNVYSTCDLLYSTEIIGDENLGGISSIVEGLYVYDNKVTAYGFNSFINNGYFTYGTLTPLKTESTYMSFDFINTWAINALINGGFPYHILTPITFDPVLSIQLSTTNIIEFGEEVTITGQGCPNDINCSLYENDIEITNPKTFTPSVGSYQYVYNTTGGVQWNNASVSEMLLVQDTSAPTITSNYNEGDIIFELNPVQFSVSESSTCNASFSNEFITKSADNILANPNGQLNISGIGFGFYDLVIGCTDSENNTGFFLASVEYRQAGSGEEYDPFNGLASIFDQQEVCPLNEGQTDRMFYIMVFVMSFVFFFFAFWLDNAVIGNLASLLLIYCGFVSIPCADFIALILIISGLTGLVLSNTQLSLTKT